MDISNMLVLPLRVYEACAKRFESSSLWVLECEMVSSTLDGIPNRRHLMIFEVQSW